MTITKMLFSTLALATLVFADGPSLKMESLPASVQSAVKAQAAHATILNISAVKANGRTGYEVEMTIDGKSRDVEFDADGKILEIEEEADLSSIPAAAKATIQTQTGKATFLKVEKVTKGPAISYVAVLKSTHGSEFELGVNAAGKLLFKNEPENDKDAALKTSRR
jgi:hypothetical protein